MSYKADTLIKPAFQWVGSKWRIGPQLIEFFPNHMRYIEVFGGTASVLLRKRESELEFLNDVHDELVNFYLVIQNDFEAFLSKVRFMLKSETMHEYFLNLKTNDRVLKAVRFYYLTKYGLCSGNLETSSLIIPKKYVKRIGGRIDNLYKIAERLKNVVVLKRDFSAVMDYLDYEDSFFFCDPPYLDDSEMYENNFNLEEHIRLRDRLKTLKGTFMLTLNVSQEVYDLYNDWAQIRTFDTLYSAFSLNKTVNNYIITNYSIEPDKKWVARIL